MTDNYMVSLCAQSKRLCDIKCTYNMAIVSNCERLYDSGNAAIG